MVTVGEYANSISTIYWSNYLGPGWVMVSYSSPLPTLIINMRLPTRCREISPPSPSRAGDTSSVAPPHGYWYSMEHAASVRTWPVDLYIDDYPNYSTWYSADGSCHGIMGMRFPDGGLLRYRKWVPQQLGDVNKQESGDSRPIGARHGDTAANYMDLQSVVRVWLTMCICSPVVVKLVRSYLALDFPLF